MLSKEKSRAVSKVTAVLIVVVLVLAGAVVYLATRPPATTVVTETEAAPTQAVKGLKIFGGLVGGGGYMQSLAFSQAVGAVLEDVRLTVIGTPGYVGNAKRLHQGLGDMGVITNLDALDILNRKGAFKEEGVYVLQMYAIAPPMYLHFLVKASSDLKTFSDLNGKKINLLTRGSLADKLGRVILDALGIKPAEIVNVPHGDAAQMLKAGDIDAALAGGLAVQYKEISVTEPLRILTLTPEEEQKLKEALPTIPIEEFDFGTWYEGAGKARVPAPWTIMAVRYDLDEDLVYRMTKAVFENKDVMAKIYKPAAALSPEYIFRTGVPLHPGALKYYEEIGLEIPDNLRPPAELYK